MAMREIQGTMAAVNRLFAQNASTQAAGEKAQRQTLLRQAQEADAGGDGIDLSAQARAYLSALPENTYDETAQADSAQAALKKATYAQADSGAGTEPDSASQKEEAQQALEALQAEKSSLYEQAQAANEQAKAAAQALEEKLKCLKIVSNLIAGKDVPGLDQRYLAKHEPELFSKAITLRAAARLKEETAKRVTCDEDFDTESDCGQAQAAGQENMQTQSVPAEEVQGAASSKAEPVNA